MMRNTSCGRRRWGTAEHYRSAEREDDGTLNVLRRICACYIARIYLLSTLSLSLIPLTTSGWFSQITYNMRPYYRAVVFSCTFSEKYQKLWLAFLRVSGRRGCLKRPLRASDLFGVSAAIPTVPPFFPQNPTAEIVARTPMLCRFAERESFGDNNVLRPRGMECVIISHSVYLEIRRRRFFVNISINI